jgi:hypothetical protein
LGHYKKANGTDPLKEMFPALKKIWGGDEVVKRVRFPVITKVAVL